MKQTIVALLASVVPLSLSAQTRITVDASKIEGSIPALIYGAGAEDVNHEIYGGLYDQRIFGESFEEPAFSLVNGFASYDNQWSLENDVLRIDTDGFGKIVYQDQSLQKASVDVDMRIDGSDAIAGFIFNVSGAGNGADAFNGYEVSVDAAERKLVVGKHENNWQPVAEVPLTVTPGEWNKLRVDFDGARFTVFLNGDEVYDYEDVTNPLTGGYVGLRSYDGSASFRNLRIDGDMIEFRALPLDVENFKRYDDFWTVTDNVMKTATSAFAKAVYQSHDMQEGSVETDVRMDGSRSISGLIVDVSDAGNGADGFRGYEISLDADDHTLVIGKHDHNWQPIESIPVSFNSSDWNRLRVDFNGNTFSVLLNGKSVYEYVDENTPLMKGKVGVRTFDGPASFRNLKINGETIALRNSPVGVSGMWLPVGNGVYMHDGTQAFNGTYSQKITGTKNDGICNFGLNKWGIGVTGEEPMKGYVYLKGDVEKAYVALQNADGSVEYCRKEISGIGEEWKRFDFEITPSASDNNARFVVALDEEGSMWVDMAMLHTQSFPYRTDLTRNFMNEKLTFLRYGGTMINAPEYKVKNMMGPRDKRPPYKGHWYRYSTNGFGIIEFVEFARKIGTEPTFSINIEDDPQDVIALLEELKPYDLKYIEIGNEENIGDESLGAYKHYVERFLAFYDAIHPLYPELQFINAAWWRQDKPELMEYVFKSLDGKAALWDYHPWTDEIDQARAVETELKNMRQMFLGWNPQTSMKCAILEENGNTHNMHRALSHAIVLNAVRKMDGFVQLDSPANALQPYLQNDNGWDQGQIFFNSSMSWCQPPYYAQQMAASHHQPLLIDNVCSNRNINMTATRSEDGRTVVLHIVNTSSNDISVDIDIKNVGNISNIKRVSLCGDLADRNTPHEPEKIVPQEAELQDMQMILEAKSYTVLEVSCDVPDNINDVTLEENQDSVYYNISGQRVADPQHGIYINDSGQKVIM